MLLVYPSPVWIMEPFLVHSWIQDPGWSAMKVLCVIHYTSCVLPRIIESPATALWLHFTRLGPTVLTVMHDIVYFHDILYATHHLILMIPECFYMYIVASFAHLITWSGLFPIPGSTHNFGGVPNVTNWQWTHREKEQFISFYTQNFPSSLWVFVCLTGICLWISVNLQRGFLIHGCWSWLMREAAPRGANLHLFAMLSYVPE